MFRPLTWIYELYILMAAVYFGYEWTALCWREKRGTLSGIFSCVWKAALTCAAAGLLAYLFWFR